MFSNCIQVKGYNRSIICDLQKEDYFLIPNSLYDFFNGDIFELNLNNKYLDDEKTTINQYISFLLEKNLIFEINENEIELFPKLDLTWDYPSTISNAIFDINNNEFNWEKIIKQLTAIQCYHIQVRSYSFLDFEQIKEICNIIFSSMIFSIEFIVPYNNKIENQNWMVLIENFPKIRNVIFYGSERNEIIHSANNGFSGVYKVISTIKSEMNCGNIQSEYFSVNIPTFTESNNYNTCLNRKISIDSEGNIKNCPSCSNSFGNIKNTTLAEAIEKPGFKDMWYITKDKIDVCKDCEFRHICTDCRVFIKDPENIYSQPAKCTYNPYIAKWQNEEGYVSVEECGNYSRETGFVPNKRKINKLNKEIWGE